jgi:hypothetical protein
MCDCLAWRRKAERVQSLMLIARSELRARWVSMVLIGLLARRE